MTKPLRYTRQQLEEAVRTSATMAEVLRKLGLIAGGGNYEIVWRRITEWRIDASQLGRYRSRWLYSEEDLRAAMGASRSLADAMRMLGFEPRPALYQRLHRDIARLSLDTSHMTGRLWSKGQRLPRRKRAKEVFVKGRLQETGKLRARLIDDGIRQRRCESCDRSSWLSKPIPLELDHINGDRTDNRLSNLRLLCPNCHALTPTYRGRNIGKSANCGVG